MNHLLRILATLVLLVGAFSGTGPQRAAGGDLPVRPGLAPAAWQSKIDEWVLLNTAAGESEFLVYLAEQADLSGAATLPTRLEKGRYVYHQLTETAQRTQPALLQVLLAQGVAYQPFWVANMVLVRGDLAVLAAVAQRSDVAHVYANPAVKADLGAQEPVYAGAAPSAIEPNLLRVKADQVWAAGFTGQGVVIGGQDTGYDWDHPALKQQYRGWNGSSANHNYAWHDAIHSLDTHNSGKGPNPCGLNSALPCDDNGHGTHTMGILVGDDGLSNHTGMAPGARWIGCRNMERGWGKPSTYAECYQWFIAPTDLSEQNPDPAMAPDVINNSWTCPVEEGCTDPTMLEMIVQNVTAAGILSVHAAGNSGKNCSTISDPAAIYTESFTVANTTILDALATSSSRGPVAWDGSRKPDVAAPGTYIRSTLRDGSYGLMSGTSMATPHVAGLAALLVSARPELAGQLAQLRYLIERTSNPSVSVPDPPLTCGGIPYTLIPNNHFGWGRIDANQALRATLLQVELNASPTSVEPDETFTYTVNVANLHPSLGVTGVVISQTLPAAGTFITATLPFTQNGYILRWEPGSLAPGASLAFTLTVQAPLDFNTTLASQSLVSSADLPDISAVRAVLVRGIQTSKHAPSLVLSGDLLTYTLSITNTHPISSVHSLVLSDALPLAAQFISATLPYTLNENVITWSSPLLTPGERWQVQLAVRSPWGAPWQVSNQTYAWHSGEFTALAGLPVNTVVKPRFQYYFAFIANSP